MIDFWFNSPSWTTTRSPLKDQTHSLPLIRYSKCGKVLTNPSSSNTDWRSNSQTSCLWSMVRRILPLDRVKCLENRKSSTVSKATSWIRCLLIIEKYNNQEKNLRLTLLPIMSKRSRPTQSHIRERHLEDLRISKSRIPMLHHSNKKRLFHQIRLPNHLQDKTSRERFLRLKPRNMAFKHSSTD